MYTIKILNLKTCLVFEATWKTFVKSEITEKVYFSIKTTFIFKTRTQDEMHRANNYFVA